MPEPTDRFSACLKIVLAHEGGYADHPADPGGATNMGITRKTLARWRSVSPWWDLPKSAVQQLRSEEAASIYKASYWERSNAQSLPAGLDLALFDYAVNSGPDRAIKSLQKLLGVVADGQVGPLTLAAIRTRVAAAGVAGLIDALCNQRLSFLTQLATFAVFGRGWRRRVEDIRKAAFADAGGPPRTPSTQPSIWSEVMNILAGYKTYIVAAAMVIAGLAQVLGVEIPTLEGHSAGQLVLEAIAIIFLRKGIKNDIGGV